MKDKTTITVCSSCKQASCWKGIFYCDYYQVAGTVEMTRKELEALGYEHPDYWRDDVTDQSIYGK